MTIPPGATLDEKRRVFDVLRSALQPALPPPQLDQAVEAQFLALGREFGGDFCRKLVPAKLASPDLPPAAPCHDPRVRADVEAAILYAEQHGIASVPDALAWFLAHRRKTAEAPNLRRCADEFLVAKRHDGRARLTLQVYRRRLDCFVATFGDRAPSSLTPEDLQRYCSRWTEPATLGGQWDTLSVFFNWMVIKSYALENPLTRTLRRPKERESPRLIYTPQEAELILREVMYTDQIGFWTLSLFAGLRSHEIERLDALPDPWQVLNLRRSLIDFAGTDITIGRRVIAMLPVLTQWLRWVKRARVRFYPANHWEKFRIVRAIVMARRYPTDAAAESGHRGRFIDGKRTHGMARRSYMSYRLALHGASYVEITDDVGTSERFLRTRFYRKASAADAREYFGLTPDVLQSRSAEAGSSK